MSSLYERLKKWDRLGTGIFTVLLLVIGFLQTCSLTFGRPVISFVQWPTLALGTVLFLERAITFPYYRRTAGIYGWILFFISFSVSMLLAARYGLRDNLRILVFMVFQVSLLYAGDRSEDPALGRSRLRLTVGCFLAGVTLLTVMSFGTMVLGQSHIFFPAEGEDVPIYYVGFHHGRLFGVYWDPNIGSLCAATAFLLSLDLFIRRRKALTRVFAAFSMVLEVFYLAFSDSRTGALCLAAGCTVYVLFRLTAKRTGLALWKKTLLVVLAVAATAAAAAALPGLIRKGSAAAIEYTQKNAAVAPEKMISFERGYDLKGDVSNRRFDIWRGAMDVVREQPVFGVSRANILPYVDEHQPENYLVNNDHMRFDSMHNLYVEILVSQGAVGLILFLASALFLAVPVLRRLRALATRRDDGLFALLTGVVAATLTATAVLTEIVYVSSPVTVLFWICAGVLDREVLREKGAEK